MKYKLHLGCGSRVIDGWVNIDAIKVHPQVNKHDLSTGIPVGDGEASFIYHEHFIEHLSESEGIKFFDECFRVLEPDGVMRISCPDLDTLVTDYNNNYLERFKVFNLKYNNKCQFINGCMRDWEHKYIYNYQDMTYKLQKAGFSDVKRCQYKESERWELKNLESRPYVGDLIIEARKSGLPSHDS